MRRLLCGLLLIVTMMMFGCGGGGGDSSTGGNNTGSAPNVPTGVSVVAGNGNITVSWNASSNATSYNLYWSTTSGVTTSTGTKVTGASSPYTHSGLTNGTPYYYVVTAVNSAGESTASSQATATPSASGGTTATLLSGSVQGRSLSLSRAVTTLAGSAGVRGSTNGIGSAARFNYVASVTTDGTNLYVLDHYSVRKIVIATGAVSLFAGGTFGTADGIGAAAQFYNWITHATCDGANLYLVDGGAIRKVNLNTAEVTTIAGSINSSGYVDGIGTAARFYNIEGLATDGVNLYISDRYAIRKMVLATGAVSVLTGAPGTSGTADGTTVTARFSGLGGITTDGTYLYAIDGNRIRKVAIATGVVTTLAGSTSSGHGDGTGVNATFYGPDEITCDGYNLYLVETHAIRKIVIATGVVTTLAGGSSSGYVDGTGTSAQFHDPRGITTDGTALFVADYYNSVIRKMN